MRNLLLVGLAAATPAGAGERTPAPANAYRTCLTAAIVRGSYTDAAPVDVVRLAAAGCRGGPASALLESDLAGLPATVALLRERRRTHAALYGLPTR